MGMSYARTGLRMILQALGLKPGDEVVLSPLTCKVVPLALLSLDVRPVYADISRETLNLDPESVEEAICARTKAILFQHTYGSSTGIEAVANLASRHGIPLIEDCAQCLPSGSGGPGTHGIAAVFSNNLRKPLPAGAGGIAVVSEDWLAAELVKARDTLRVRGGLSRLFLRVEAAAHKYLLKPETYWSLLGLKKRFGVFYRSCPLEAEIRKEIMDSAFQISRHQVRAGLMWIDALDELRSVRRQHVRTLAIELSHMPSYEIPEIDSDAALYYFPILSKSKERLLRAAEAKRIELIAWPVDLPIYPVEDPKDLERYAYKSGCCPQAEEVARSLIGIPTDQLTTARHRERALALLREHETVCQDSVD